MFICIVFIPAAWVQAETLRASHFVSITNSVYDDLDLFAAHGLIRVRVMGERPYTREQIVFFVREARKNLDVLKASVDANKKARTINFLEGILAHLEKKFRQDTDKKISPVQNTKLSLLYLNSDRRAYNSDGLVATYNPLTHFQDGRHFIDGLQSHIESSHWLRLNPYFSAYAKSLVQFQFVNHEQENENRFYFQEAYAEIALWNMHLVIGRQPIIWGQGRNGGYILSNNARPLDAVSFRPLTPWSLGRAGKLQYGMFFANLGSEQNFRYPFLSGMKLIYLPWDFLEIGLVRALIFGGQNAPTGSFGTQIAEYIGARPSDFNSVNLSNSINGFEWRLRAPQMLHGIEFYGEVYFDDFNMAHILRSFEQDASVMLGLNFPRVDTAGKWGVRLEVLSTTDILYEHSRWVTGWSLNGQVLGLPLGQDADSLAFTVTRRFKKGIVAEFESNLEQISSDVYAAGSFGRRVLTEGINESRLRFNAGLVYPYNEQLSITARTGYEHVWNFGFASGDARDHFMLGLGIAYDFENSVSGGN